MKVVSLLLVLGAASGSRVISDKNALRKSTNGHMALASPGTQGVMLPMNLAVLAEQCKCKFVGLCTCTGAAQFMDCLADACSSGACSCGENSTDDLFEQKCNGMARVCPTVGLQCSPKSATCLQQPILNDESVDDIVLDLKGMKERKCKLEEAVHAGFVNADNRLRELEPPIQSRLDLLIHKGVKKADMPWMGCSPAEPTAEVKASGNALEEAVSEVKSEVKKEEVSALAVKQSPTPGVLQFYLESKIEEPQRKFVMMMLGLGHVILLLVFAAIYNGTRAKTNFQQTPPAGEVDKNHFRYGLCGCFQDIKITALAFCCWPIRWADTVDKANKNGSTLNYWPAVLMMIALIMIANGIHYVLLYPWAASCVSLITVAIAVVYRQKMRKQYGFKAGGMTCVEDIFTYMCCGCCAVVQEAREVEATRTNEK